MKRIEINLNDPFEKTLAAVLTLPEGGDGRSARRETLTEALQYLYTAAHGRTLQTSIGAIRIMPATDPSLRDASRSLDTRSDLLALAERRTAFTPRASRNGASSHARFDSAFSDFLAGRLGSPDGWAPPAHGNEKTSHHERS
jgi:hypothetical protein